MINVLIAFIMGLCVGEVFGIVVVALLDGGDEE